MYEQHTSWTTPPDDTVIWRYTNIDKILHLLSTQKLFLCRLDKFKDPWEGVYPKKFVEEIRGNWLQNDANDLFSTSKQLRRTFFVNCWHENEYESAALWDQYSQFGGLAIRTTIGHLKQSISDVKNFYIGRVKYLDYDKDTVPAVNLLEAAFLKRKSFQHEKEVRIMFFDNSQIETGTAKPNQAIESHSLQVDLSELIQELYLSPNIENWLIPQIEELFSRYNFPNIRLKKSDLYDPHIY